MIKKILLSLTLVLSVFALAACKPDETVDPIDDPVETNEAPVLYGKTQVFVGQGLDFDNMDGVTAIDVEDGDITADVTVAGTVDTSTLGDYTLTYTVEDSKGESDDLTVTVTVLPLANYSEGVDLSKLSVESKDILFAAAERYLLENVYAGIPLYNGATRVMYSDRVQLYSPTYNGVMGFGTEFSQFTADDSTVEMFAGTYGNAGEYTWRAVYSTDPVTLNPWLSDDSATSDFIDMFTGGLYEMHFDATKTGYQIDPSLAASDPVAVDGTVINGKTYSKVWEITLKDDLTWTFHPDTDLTGLDAGYEDLDASDYLWTWELALTEKWFRAKSGGGDFISHGVKNAAEFIAGDVTDFAEVGLKVVGDNTLQIEFVTDKSQFDIKYMFTGSSLAPINEELYTSLANDDDDNTAYGLDPESVASSGKYYFDTWTSGQLLTFKKNDAHPDAALYHYTGYRYTFLSGTEQIFEEFLAGRLESASVPSDQIEDFVTDPRVKVAPQATTWRLMTNAFGTTAARDEFIANYPDIQLDDSYVPEPILMYTEMRQALYYGFDREYAAIDLVKTYLPQHTLFASTYFLDGESGMSVRTLDAGAAVVTDFGQGSFGYVKDAATSLFYRAVSRAVADGYYTKGTEDNYTIIELQLYYASSGSTSAQAMVAELEKQYEANLVDDVNFVKIDIVVNDVAFPGNYYDHMMVANMDLGIGGISGSLLDAPGFLDVFNDDNTGGFTLNWGIDTTTANIPVTYTNMEGVEVTEVWSYNALVAALQGTEFIKNGTFQTTWDTAQAVINARLTMAGEVADTITLDTEYAEYILGDTLANLAEEAEVDALVAYVVVTESGANLLYVIAQDGADYSLHARYSLYTDVEKAMVAHSGGYVLGSSYLLADDAAIAADAYLGGDYSTIAEIATELGLPLEFVEIYSTTWADEDYDGTDAYVVLHINEYFIPIKWL